jgi:hypothetical protein
VLKSDLLISTHHYQLGGQAVRMKCQGLSFKTITTLGNRVPSVDGAGAAGTNGGAGVVPSNESEAAESNSDVL